MESLSTRIKYSCLKLIEDPNDRGWYHLTGLIPKNMLTSVLKHFETKGHEIEVKKLGGLYEIKHRKEFELDESHNQEIK